MFASQAAAAITNARTYRAEKQARADLEAVVETSPVGVVVLDVRSGKVVSFNRKARLIVDSLRLPGQAVEELVETVVFRRADGTEIALAELPLSEALRDAQTVRAEEIELVNSAGCSVTTLINCTPISGEDGAMESVVVTLQDLAPFLELERTRANFLNMVSHELRTPLTSIKGSTAAVLGASRLFAPAEMHEFFRIIDEQADRVLALIADLLDAGRIESGTLSVSPEPTEVTLLIERARTTFLSANTHHDVLVELPPGLPRVMADRQRIDQVLGNLLANAARHSPKSPKIRVKAEHDGIHVSVSVIDGGSGIPPERLKRLFQKYSGLSDGGNGGKDGFGLGLAICKGLVEAHGGRIWAESEGAGHGARFTLKLPVAAVAGEIAQAGAWRPDDAAREHEPQRILVVDDDPQILNFARDALSDAGFAPVVTGVHDELGQIIRTEKPDLVLLDLMLPGTDGISLMNQVPLLAELPVIFISAYGRDETIARALEAGADDYIVKPFSAIELTARVRAVLKRQTAPEWAAFGDLAIDYQQCKVAVAGKPVDLTATEYQLLRVLSVNAGRTLSFQSLLNQVWGARTNAGTNNERAFVKQLRQKLGDDSGDPRWIVNVRGIGYRMIKPD